MMIFKPQIQRNGEGNIVLRTKSNMPLEFKEGELGLQHTSMSVGDVIKIEKNIWVVDKSGFKLLQK